MDPSFLNASMAASFEDDYIEYHVYLDCIPASPLPNTTSTATATAPAASSSTQSGSNPGAGVAGTLPDSYDADSLALPARRQMLPLSACLNSTPSDSSAQPQTTQRQAQPQASAQSPSTETVSALEYLQAVRVACLDYVQPFVTAYTWHMQPFSLAVWDPAAHLRRTRNGNLRGASTASAPSGAGHGRDQDPLVAGLRSAMGQRGAAHTLTGHNAGAGTTNGAGTAMPPLPTDLDLTAIATGARRAKDATSGTSSSRSAADAASGGDAAGPLSELARAVSTHAFPCCAHLHGCVRFDNNLNDEWAVVLVLLALTARFPDLTVVVSDRSSGQFLLTEAAAADMARKRAAAIAKAAAASNTDAANAIVSAAAVGGAEAVCVKPDGFQFPQFDYSRIPQSADSSLRAADDNISVNAGPQTSAAAAAPTGLPAWCQDPEQTPGRVWLRRGQVQLVPPPPTLAESVASAATAAAAATKSKGDKSGGSCGTGPRSASASAADVANAKIEIVCDEDDEHKSDLSLALTPVLRRLPTLTIATSAAADSPAAAAAAAATSSATSAVTSAATASAAADADASIAINTPALAPAAGLALARGPGAPLTLPHHAVQRLLLQKLDRLVRRGADAPRDLSAANLSTSATAVAPRPAADAADATDAVDLTALARAARSRPLLASNALMVPVLLPQALAAVVGRAPWVAAAAAAALAGADERDVRAVRAAKRFVNGEIYTSAQNTQSAMHAGQGDCEQQRMSDCDEQSKSRKKWFDGMIGVVNSKSANGDVDTFADVNCASLYHAFSIDNSICSQSQLRSQCSQTTAPATHATAAATTTTSATAPAAATPATTPTAAATEPGVEFRWCWTRLTHHTYADLCRAHRGCFSHRYAAALPAALPQALMANRLPAGALVCGCAQRDNSNNNNSDVSTGSGGDRDDVVRLTPLLPGSGLDYPTQTLHGRRVALGQCHHFWLGPHLLCAAAVLRGMLLGMHLGARLAAGAEVLYQRAAAVTARANADSNTRPGFDMSANGNTANGSADSEARVTVTNTMRAIADARLDDSSSAATAGIEVKPPRWVMYSELYNNMMLTVTSSGTLTSRGNSESSSFNAYSSVYNACFAPGSTNTRRIPRGLLWYLSSPSPQCSRTLSLAPRFALLPMQADREQGEASEGERGAGDCERLLSGCGRGEWVTTVSPLAQSRSANLAVAAFIDAYARITQRNKNHNNNNTSPGAVPSSPPLPSLPLQLPGLSAALASNAWVRSFLSLPMPAPVFRDTAYSTVLPSLVCRSQQARDGDSSPQPQDAAAAPASHDWWYPLAHPAASFPPVKPPSLAHAAAVAPPAASALAAVQATSACVALSTQPLRRSAYPTIAAVPAGDSNTAHAMHALTGTVVCGSALTVSDRLCSSVPDYNQHEELDLATDEAEAAVGGDGGSAAVTAAFGRYLAEPSPGLLVATAAAVASTAFTSRSANGSGPRCHSLELLHAQSSVALSAHDVACLRSIPETTLVDPRASAAPLLLWGLAQTGYATGASDAAASRCNARINASSNARSDGGHATATKNSAFATAHLDTAAPANAASTEKKNTLKSFYDSVTFARAHINDAIDANTTAGESGDKKRQFWATLGINNHSPKAKNVSTQGATVATVAMADDYECDSSAPSGPAAAAPRAAEGWLPSHMRQHSSHGSNTLADETQTGVSHAASKTNSFKGAVNVTSMSDNDLTATAAYIAQQTKHLLYSSRASESTGADATAETTCGGSKYAGNDDLVDPFDFGVLGELLAEMERRAHNNEAGNDAADLASVESNVVDNSVEDDGNDEDEDDQYDDEDEDENSEKEEDDDGDRNEDESDAARRNKRPSGRRVRFANISDAVNSKDESESEPLSNVLASLQRFMSKRSDYRGIVAPSQSSASATNTNATHIRTSANSSLDQLVAAARKSGDISKHVASKASNSTDATVAGDRAPSDAASSGAAPVTLNTSKVAMLLAQARSRMSQPKSTQGTNIAATSTATSSLTTASSSEGAVVPRFLAHLASDSEDGDDAHSKSGGVAHRLPAAAPGVDGGFTDDSDTDDSGDESDGDDGGCVTGRRTGKNKKQAQVDAENMAFAQMIARKYGTSDNTKSVIDGGDVASEEVLRDHDAATVTQSATREKTGCMTLKSLRAAATSAVSAEASADSCSQQDEEEEDDSEATVSMAEYMREMDRQLGRGVHAHSNNPGPSGNHHHKKKTQNCNTAADSNMLEGDSDDDDTYDDNQRISDTKGPQGSAEYSVLKNLLAAVSAQGGLPGPATALLKSLGVTLPSVAAVDQERDDASDCDQD